MSVQKAREGIKDVKQEKIYISLIDIASNFITNGNGNFNFGPIQECALSSIFLQFDVS